jgi:hypothetical protein
MHEGKYAAEVDVELIETDTGWAPCLSLEDAYKLYVVRDALRRGDIKAASRLARVFALTPVAVQGSRKLALLDQEEIAMPTISVFYGIIIQMFWREHSPPHFHALYAEHEAVIDIRELRVMRGSLPRRAMALVLEWAAEHRDELMEDWSLCSQLKTPKPIEPLG